MSNIFSSSSSAEVRAASSRPIRKMRHDALPLGDERVGRLLDAVVKESIGGIGTAHEPGTDGFPEGGVKSPARSRHGPASASPVSARFPRQASWPKVFWVASGRRPQLPCHEIHHIVGEALGADARQVPTPTWCIGFEDSSASSASAPRNWIVKEGMPAVFSNTSSAKDTARPGSVCSASVSKPRHIRGQKGLPAGSPAISPRRRGPQPRGSSSAFPPGGCAAPTSLSR